MCADAWSEKNPVLEVIKLYIIFFSLMMALRLSPLPYSCYPLFYPFKFFPVLMCIEGKKPGV